MVKLVGYISMSKKKGKVLFIEQDGGESVVGKITDKVFLFDDLSEKVKPEHIGHEIVISYGKGYSGAAYVSDITVK